MESHHAFVDSRAYSPQDLTAFYLKQHSEGEEGLYKKTSMKKLDTTKLEMTKENPKVESPKLEEEEKSILNIASLPFRRAKLSKKINKYKLYDNIWGMIEMPIEVKLLSEHKYFLRLKEISQLSIMKYIIPTANHSRYEHSIGVMYLSYITALHLHELYPHEIPIDLVICAALAGASHDIGHGMFSHAYDNLLDEQKFESPGRKHEYRSLKIFEYAMRDIMKDYSSICNITEEMIHFTQFLIDQDKYKRFIDPELTKLPKYKKGFEQIINNSVHKLDVDKMDYILRDSKHMGIPYSNNQELIITMLQRTDIINDTWVFDIRDRRMIELLLHQRYTLYSNYYVGDKSLGMAIMLNDVLIEANKYIDIISCANLKDTKEADVFCSLTDDKFLLMILNLPEIGLKRTSLLIENIMTNKNCYAIVDDFVESSDSHSKRTGYKYIPVSLFTDKSNPEQALSKIIYHNGGEIIDHRDILLVREINTKTKRR